MQHLRPTELTTVVGGTKQNDQITQQLTTLQSSLKDLTDNNSGSGSNNNMFMMMAMCMAMRPQPTVVAGGGPAVAAAGPVVNISTRVRHF